MGLPSSPCTAQSWNLSLERFFGCKSMVRILFGNISRICCCFFLDVAQCIPYFDWIILSMKIMCLKELLSTFFTPLPSKVDHGWTRANFGLYHPVDTEVMYTKLSAIFFSVICRNPTWHQRKKYSWQKVLSSHGRPVLIFWFQNTTAAMAR